MVNGHWTVHEGEDLKATMAGVACFWPAEHPGRDDLGGTISGDQLRGTISEGRSRRDDLGGTISEGRSRRGDLAVSGSLGEGPCASLGTKGPGIATDWEGESQGEGRGS